LGRCVFLFNNGGNEVCGFDKAAVLGVVLSDGGQLLFFSEDFDRFSGKRTKITYILYTLIFNFSETMAGVK
jgi:hypothetical protein